MDNIYFHNASKMNMIWTSSRSCSSRFFSRYHRFFPVFLSSRAMEAYNYCFWSFLYSSLTPITWNISICVVKWFLREIASSSASNHATYDRTCLTDHNLVYDMVVYLSTRREYIPRADFQDFIDDESLDSKNGVMDILFVCSQPTSIIYLQLWKPKHRRWSNN